MQWAQHDEDRAPIMDLNLEVALSARASELAPSSRRLEPLLAMRFWFEGSTSAGTMRAQKLIRPLTDWGRQFRPMPRCRLNLYLALIFQSPAPAVRWRALERIEVFFPLCRVHLIYYGRSTLRSKLW